MTAEGVCRDRIEAKLSGAPVDQVRPELQQ
jgi:hypothetical protein